jgi:hypothetical protein
MYKVLVILSLLFRYETRIPRAYQIRIEAAEMGSFDAGVEVKNSEENLKSVASVKQFLIIG